MQKKKRGRVDRARAEKHVPWRQVRAEETGRRREDNRNERDNYKSDKALRRVITVGMRRESKGRAGMGVVQNRRQVNTVTGLRDEQCRE